MNDVVPASAVQEAENEVCAVAQAVTPGGLFVRQTSTGESSYQVAEVVSRDPADAVVKLHGIGARASLGDFKETVSKLVRNGYHYRPGN